jgi:hypothetical protein
MYIHTYAAAPSHRMAHAKATAKHSGLFLNTSAQFQY